MLAALQIVKCKLLILKSSKSRVLEDKPNLVKSMADGEFLENKQLAKKLMMEERLNNARPRSQLCFFICCVAAP